MLKALARMPGQGLQAVLLPSVRCTFRSWLRSGVRGHPATRARRLAGSGWGGSDHAQLEQPRLLPVLAHSVWLHPAAIRRLTASLGEPLLEVAEAWPGGAWRFW